MALRKFLYPLDLTGMRGSNRINESHVIGNETYRAFALKNGPFYPDDLVVTEQDTGRELKRGDDYECVFLYEDLTALTAGKEVCGVIVVHNKNISTKIDVEVNIVGGPFVQYAQAIADAIEQLEIDNRNVYWQNVLNKPEIFKPAPHNHDIADIFGFEFIIDVLGAIRDTMIIGDNGQYIQLMERIDELEKELSRKIKEHADLTNNPHGVEASQANTYSKEEIDALLLKVQQEFDKLGPKFTAISTSLNLVNERIDGLVSAINNVRNTVDNNSREVSRMNKLLADLNTEIDGIKDHLGRLDIEIEALKERDTELQRGIDANYTAIVKERKRVDATNQHLTEVDSTLNEHGAGIQNLETANELLTRRVSSLESWQQNAEERFRKLEQLLNKRGVGELVYYARTPNREDKVVLANGAWLDKKLYADLFSVLGTYYGDGGSTFKIPDARGLYMRAMDHGRGIDSGRGLGSFQDQRMINHWHGTGWFNQSGNDDWFPLRRAFHLDERYTTRWVAGEGNRVLNMTYNQGTYINGTNATATTRAFYDGGEVRVKNIAFPVYIRYA